MGKRVERNAELVEKFEETGDAGPAARFEEEKEGLRPEDRPKERATYQRMMNPVDQGK